MSTKFDLQMIGCQRKGKEAFERGESRDSCPYKPKPWSFGSGAKNLTKLRKQYWLFGYDLAAGQVPEEPAECVTTEKPAWRHQRTGKRSARNAEKS